MDDETTFRWDDVLDRLRPAAGPRRRIIRLLGVGGMAGVYLAEDLELDRLIAIKVMAPGLLEDPRSIQRFKWEAQAMARIGHPNIVTIHATRELDGLHFLEMAYVPGRRLADVIRDGSQGLPMEMAFHWLAQIGSALAHAHRAKVVHRDIKPANVLLDADGNAVVTDFGIAKLAADTPLVTATIIGTPAYMSPEQCSGDPIRAATDQYAFGVLAYELLAGQLPFSGKAAALMVAHLTHEPAPLLEHRPDCPPSFAAAVSRMLAKSPDDRFPDMEAALAALGVVALGDFHPLRHDMRTLALPRELRLEPTRLVLAPAGASRRLAARVVAWNDVQSEPVSPVWQSSNDGVARIDAEGTVTADQEGEAEITATFDDLHATLDVLVRTPCHLIVEQSTIRFTALDERQTLGARVTDADGRAMDVAVTWKTSNTSVASIEAGDVLVAAGVGSCVVVAQTGELSARIDVTVSPDPSIGTTRDTMTRQLDRPLHGPVNERGAKGRVPAPIGTHESKDARRWSKPLRRTVAALSIAGAVVLAWRLDLMRDRSATGTDSTASIPSDNTSNPDLSLGDDDPTNVRLAADSTPAATDDSTPDSGAAVRTLGTANTNQPVSRRGPGPAAGDSLRGADPIRERPVAARQITNGMVNVLQLLRERGQINSSPARTYQIAARADLEAFLELSYESIHWNMENPVFDDGTGEATIVVHIGFVGGDATPRPPVPFIARLSRDEGPWRVVGLRARPRADHLDWPAQLTRAREY